MLAWILRGIAVVLLLLAGLLALYLKRGHAESPSVVENSPEYVPAPQPIPQPTPIEIVFGQWGSFDEYQNEVEQNKSRRLYPAKVEGRNEDGISQYRAKYVPFLPDPFYFESHHNMSEEDYLAFKDRLYSEGCTLVHEQHFTDSMGVIRYQATWVKH